MMATVPTEYGMLLAALLFCIGLVGLLVRRNVISAAEARSKAKIPENFPG